MGAALDGLIKAELIYRRGLPPEATYLFKHALMRDAAYESLLKEKRRAIHCILVEIFEADKATAAPELIAHHATKARLTEKAVTLWGKAGSNAQVRPAYDEAINHLRMALSVVKDLTGQPMWRERELTLLVQLAQVYVAKEGIRFTRGI